MPWLTLSGAAVAQSATSASAPTRAPVTMWEILIMTSPCIRLVTRDALMWFPGRLALFVAADVVAVQGEASGLVNADVSERFRFDLNFQGVSQEGRVRD